MYNPKLYTNFFCFLSAEGGVKSFDKSDLKADTWKEYGKSFTKTCFLLCICFNNQKCFPLHVCKVFLPKSGRMQSPASGFKFSGTQA